MEIIEPPPKRGNSGSREHWVTTVDTLRTQYPGRFGKVGTYSNGVSTQIRKGMYPAFYPKDVTDKADYMLRHWEVTTRSSEEGRGRNDLYIKYIGDGCTCRYCV